MRYVRAVVVLSCAVLGISGCATMFAGGAKTVRIESEPAGATVTTQNGLTLGTTPLITNLRADNYVLRFSMEGRQDASFALNRKVQGIAFLNLLCVLCWGIDFATGALWGLDEGFVRVTLPPQATSRLDLHQMACENYAALQLTAERGTISQDVHSAGRALVQQATAVEEGSCKQAE